MVPGEADPVWELTVEGSGRRPAGCARGRAEDGGGVSASGAAGARGSTGSELLAAVETQGETVLICRNGKPVAELRAIRATVNPLRVHPRLSKVVFHEDPTAPLAPEDWPGR